jgi:RHS repeat-associated protein
MRFTGHQRDTQGTTTQADDVDYLHARYYNPTIARFLSIDPVRGNPRTPQSWNLYAYVQNNPVNATDPDGRLLDWLKKLVSGELFQEWFKSWVGKQTKPETQQTEQEKQEQRQVLEEAGLPESNRGAVLGTGGERYNDAGSTAVKDVVGSVVREGTSVVVIGGVAKGVSALSRVKNISGKDLLRQLEKAGASVRPGRGSHMKVTFQGRTTSVPVHGNQSLPKGTLNDILKDLGLK